MKSTDEIKSGKTQDNYYRIMDVGGMPTKYYIIASNLKEAYKLAKNNKNFSYFSSLKEVNNQAKKRKNVNIINKNDNNLVAKSTVSQITPCNAVFIASYSFFLCLI